MIHFLMRMLLFILFLPAWILMAKDSDSITTLDYQLMSHRQELYQAKDGQGNLWVRAKMSDTLLGHQVLIQNRSIHLVDYELYAYQNGHLKKQSANVDLNGHFFKSRYPIYHLQPSNTTFYLNLKKGNPNELRLFVDEFGQFGQMVSLIVFYFSMYYGFALMVIVFNFVFYLIFRDPRFISYLLLQFSILLIFFYEDGLFYYFSDGAFILPYFSLWSTTFASIFAAIFTYYFLELKTHFPFIKKVILVSSLVLFLLAFMHTLTDFEAFKILSTLACFGLPLFCFYQAIKLFSHSVYARFLLISFGAIVLIGGICVFNRHFHISFLSFFNLDILRLACVIEMMAISFVLIFKVRSLREENDRYKIELRYYLSHLHLNKELETERNKNKQISKVQSSENETGSMVMEEIQEKYQLTDREIQVLNCIWTGDSNKEIAAKLYISIHTVKFHVNRLYTKLEVSNRSEARLLKSKLLDQ